ncbi:unnamed protein product [Mucor hiemalis]
MMTLMIPFAQASVFDTVTGAVSTIYDAYSWLKKHSNPLNKELVNKVDSTWNEQDITWFTLKNSEMKIHFLYPKYKNSGQWQTHQAIIAAEIAKGGNNGGTVQNLLDDIQDVAQKFDWEYKLIRQSGPVFSYFRNNGKVQWFEKCCSIEYWVALGPYSGWSSHVLPDSTMRSRADAYQRTCDATSGSKLGSMC